MLTSESCHVGKFPGHLECDPSSHPVRAQAASPDHAHPRLHLNAAFQCAEKPLGRSFWRFLYTATLLTRRPQTASGPQEPAHSRLGKREPDAGKPSGAGAGARRPRRPPEAGRAARRPIPLPSPAPAHVGPGKIRGRGTGGQWDPGARTGTGHLRFGQPPSRGSRAGTRAPGDTAWDGLEAESLTEEREQRSPSGGLAGRTLCAPNGRGDVAGAGGAVLAGRRAPAPTGAAGPAPGTRSLHVLSRQPGPRRRRGEARAPPSPARRRYSHPASRRLNRQRLHASDLAFPAEAAPVASGCSCSSAQRPRLIRMTSVILSCRL